MNKTLIPSVLLLAAAASVTASAATKLPENLYLIGSATPAGWNNNAPVQMEKVNDYEFTYTGGLTEGEFKFPWVVGDAMWSSETYMAMESGEKVGKNGIANGEAYLTDNGQPDNKWVVTDPGRYKLTFVIDKTDTAFGELKVEYLGELADAIYMLGSATGAWFSNEGTPVYEQDGKFVWTGDLNYYDEDKIFKFCLSRGDWDKVTFLVPTEVNHNDNVLQIEPGTYSYMESAETEPGALKDWFWGLTEGKSGKYEVTVDTSAKTVTLKLLQSYAFDRDNVAELYMLGLVAESFDSNHPLPMTSQGNGKFVWTGTLDYATTDGDENHANKQFKFVTPKGDWNKVYYLVPEGADADGYIQAIVPGTYPLMMSTWTAGKTGVDAFFGVTEGTKGVYTITVDVPGMSLKLEEGNTGIDGVEAAAAVSFDGKVLRVNAPEAVIYDIAGRKVMTVGEGAVDLSGMAGGIYVVTAAGESMKINL